MTALELLLTRQSDPLLTSPAPNKKEIETILAAGMNVPDHAALQPFKFTVVQGHGLNVLSELFVDAVTDNNPSQAKLDKTAKMPFRAPLIIVISTDYQSHDKVPKREQLITAGCSAHAMQMAAFSMGYGAMWRTGELTYNTTVKAGLSVEQDNDIVGFLYIGTKTKALAKKTRKFFDDRVSYL